jgi:hypothetical protein
VSSGDKTSIDSIDGLMSAIYHRFGFLDFVKDEIGIGIGKESLSDPADHSVYVYNMGNSALNALCQGPAFSDFGRYYYEVCEPDIHIAATEFEEVQKTAQGNNPSIVLWPADGDTDVPPVFFEESPDPLPDYSVSGYPISIQFNPSFFSEADVTEFKLYRQADNREIELTRLLTENTDPNGKLSGLEYALFPLERLEWETAYQVQAKYTSPKGADTLTWRFQTRGVGMPLYTSDGDGDVISIPSNTSTFAVYVPPNSTDSRIGQINYNYQYGMTVKADFIDGNTLKIDLNGSVGQQATFSFSGGRSFVTKVSAAVTTETPTQEVEPTPICEPATLSVALNAHVPNLIFTPSQGEPMLLWGNLDYQGDLLFKLAEYDYQNSAVASCEAATLSLDGKLHIPSLSYTSPAGETAIFWADLEVVDADNLVFKLVEYGLKK